MYKSIVYEGDDVVGEVEIYPQNQGLELMKEIRISHYSQPSERCPPLAVLHTITSCGVCFKMESSKAQSQDTPLYLLHSTCIRENKTAVMSLGEEELHLVAMYSKKKDGQYPCFWGFNVALGLYSSCLVMLNLRCLGIVFDLDETLIVANTMRSFEDRIEALQRKINTEVDPQRMSGMLAEVRRYQDDRNILKQYAENDQVVENGKLFKTQPEIVPALSDNHQPIVRPLVRLQEKNIILTRINPLIRDTSVLVRLRPAWEDLRSYLTARGRKRFEVYVCTMAERDYALEMWRLLDPESNLINSKELLDRIVCVKSGSRKSLFNVFQDGICHPKMALVIDDRLKVWDEKDQPRVHVVPAFAPYYAPQAEANNAISVLCVARNVACNVRGGFFKEFDEGLLQRIPEISYEDDMKDIPSAPDVSNYLVSEDDASASNGNRDQPCFDSMADVEVERRLKDAISAPSTVTSLDPRLAPPLQYGVVASSGLVPQPAAQGSIMPFSNKQFPQSASLIKPLAPEPTMQSSPAREEGEVPESELDPDTRRRLLILQHGQDTRDQASNDPPFPVRPPIQVSVPRVPSRGSWFPVDEEMSPRQLNRAVPKEFPLDSDTMHIEKHRPHHPSFFHKVESSVSSDRILHENQRLSKEALHRDDRLRLNHSLPGYNSFSGPNVRRKTIIGISAGVAVCIVLFVMVCCFRIIKCPLVVKTLVFWKKETEDDQIVEAFIRNYGSLAPKRYKYSDVKKMTNSFTCKLGQGGFGCVYKGKLNDGRQVAVKLLSESKGNGQEFINEVASIIRTSHVNIVTLMGFCFERSRRALIYEFMPNGSLDKFIYNKGSSNENLTLEWKSMYQIAVGIARGLEYLYRGCNTRILHFDIKPHNILLDQNFIPKISDFGLAKLCQTKESMVSMTHARGTAGYIAPEVFCRNFGGVSHKSDVYSYGMLVLEMVGGRKNIDVQVSHTSQIHFPTWIYTQLQPGKDLTLCSITNEEEEETARKMVLVGLWCIQPNPSDRPSIDKVVEMLEGSSHLLETPPNPSMFSPQNSP